MSTGANRSIWIIALTTRAANVAIHDDALLNLKRNPEEDLRILTDGEWYRLSGLRHQRVVLVPGWEKRKDADKLKGLLDTSGAFVRQSFATLERKPPHVAS